MSQKNPEILKAIAQGLSVIFKPVDKPLTNPFEMVKIYHHKPSGVSVLRFNTTQNYFYTKYIDSNCSKVTWNELGIELIFIIHEFKRLYEFRKMATTLKSSNQTAKKLINWNNSRSNFITYAQLLRILCRDPLSKEVTRLVTSLNQTNQLQLKEKDFHFNGAFFSLENHFFKILSNILFKNKNLPIKGKANWEKLIDFIFVENEISNLENTSKIRLDKLKQKMVFFIRKSLNYICERQKLNKITSNTNHIQTTYYPNLQIAKKALRNFNWVDDKLFKVTLLGSKKVWYKTKNVLK